MNRARAIKSAFFFFLFALPSFSNPLEDWDKFEKAVRDQRIAKAEAKQEFPALMDSIVSFARRFTFSPRDHWIFPVHGHSLPDVGKGGFKPDIRYGSSPIMGYDFYDGNLHGGHPAYDIFIADKNMDCLDDRNGKPCDIVAPEDIIVLSCFTTWEQGSDLRGGNYLWGFEMATRRLFYFAHLRSIAVRPGDFCKAGTPLGVMGRTGKNAAHSRSPTHLHFMVLDARNAQLLPVDTWKFLERSDCKKNY
jgi:hypothetical protein